MYFLLSEMSIPLRTLLATALTYLVLTVATSGCANSKLFQGGDLLTRQVEGQDTSGNTTHATVFAWDADRSATIVNSLGFSCFQIAEVFEERSSEVSATLVTALTRAIASDSTAPSDRLEFARIAATEGLALSERDELNTFINIGLFHICMINANGGLKANGLNGNTVQSESLAAIMKLMDTAIEIERIRAETVTRAVPVASELQVEEPGSRVSRDVVPIPRSVGALRDSVVTTESPVE